MHCLHLCASACTQLDAILCPIGVVFGSKPLYSKGATRAPEVTFAILGQGRVMNADVEVAFPSINIPRIQRWLCSSPFLRLWLWWDLHLPSPEVQIRSVSGRIPTSHVLADRSYPRLLGTFPCCRVFACSAKDRNLRGDEATNLSLSQRSPPPQVFVIVLSEKMYLGFMASGTDLLSCISRRTWWPGLKSAQTNMASPSV